MYNFMLLFNVPGVKASKNSLHLGHLNPKIQKDRLTTVSETLFLLADGRWVTEVQDSN